MTTPDAGDAARDRPHGPIARLGGAAAAAAGAPALLALPAAGLLVAAEAPGWAGALALLGAAPLAAVAAAASVGSAAPARSFAFAAAPLFAAAAWLAWSSGGALSPATALAFAALAPIALLAAPSGAALATLLAAAAAALFAFGPDTPTPLGVFAARETREIVAAAAWAAAGASVAAVAFAAQRAWTSALPALRHPDIARARALEGLADGAGAVGLDVADGRVVRVVGATDAALSLARSAVEGASLDDLLHPDDRSAAAALAPGGPPTSLRVRTASGGFAWAEARRIADPDGDATDPMRLALRRRWRDGDGAGPDVGAAAAARDAIGEAVLAHMRQDVRSALKSVSGYAEILKNELFGPLGGPRYRAYATDAHAEAQSALHLIDEILDLAELEAGRFEQSPELLDPLPLVEAALEIARPGAEARGVALETDVPPSTPFVRADRRALRRMLANMASDAIARARLGDVVVFAAAADDGAIRFTVSARASDGPGDADAAAPPALEGPDPESRSDAAFAAAETAATARPDGEAGGDAPARPSLKLGRIAAANLAARMGGDLVFSGGLDDAGASMEVVGSAEARLFSEAILPTPIAAPGAVEQNRNDAA